MITPLQFKTIFPKIRNPNVWCRVLDKMVDEFELRPIHRFAMFLAQAGFESSSFNVLRENLSYTTAARLRAVYPVEFPTDDAAQRYVVNPMGLANFVYADKNGNGNTASGDGFKYRGGGLFELTGRENYERVGKALGMDLLVRPKQIEQETIAARTAGFFWVQNDLNTAADDANFDFTTRRINGKAMEGAAERRAIWTKVVEVLGTPTEAEVAIAARRAITPPLDGVHTPGFAGASIDTTSEPEEIPA